MPKQLEFMDCPHCGKRMVTTAVRCGHCKKSPHDFDTDLQSEPNQDETTELQDEEVEVDGEVEDEDEEYEEFIAREFPHESNSKRRSPPTWIWVTAWILLVVTILPLALAALNLIANL